MSTCDAHVAANKDALQRGDFMWALELCQAKFNSDVFQLKHVQIKSYSSPTLDLPITASSLWPSCLQYKQPQ